MPEMNKHKTCCFINNRFWSGWPDALLRNSFKKPCAELLGSGICWLHCSQELTQFGKRCASLGSAKLYTKLPAPEKKVLWVKLLTGNTSVKTTFVFLLHLTPASTLKSCSSHGYTLINVSESLRTLFQEISLWFKKQLCLCKKARSIFTVQDQ